MKIKLLITFIFNIYLGLIGNNRMEYCVAPGVLATFEQDNIKINYGSFPGFRLWGNGFPNTIVIHNLSNKEVTIDSSIINNEMLSSGQVEEITSRLVKNCLTVMVGGEMFIGALLASTLRKNIFRAMTISLAGAVSYGTYKLFYNIIKNGNKIRKDMMIEGPIVLKPKQMIQKIFWLKNPKEMVKINFGAVK